MPGNRTPLDETLAWIEREVLPRLSTAGPPLKWPDEESKLLQRYMDAADVANSVGKFREIGAALTAAAERWDSSLEATLQVERDVRALQTRLDTEVEELMIMLLPPGIGDAADLAELGLREMTLEDRFPPAKRPK